MSEALTFSEWRAKNRHVKRGERSTQRNTKGEPVFTLEQTDRTQPYMGRFGGGRFGDGDNGDNYDGPSEYDLNIGWDKS